MVVLHRLQGGERVPIQLSLGFRAELREIIAAAEVGQDQESLLPIARDNFGRAQAGRTQLVGDQDKLVARLFIRRDPVQY